MSNDYGSSWRNIAGNMPASPVNVILEDPENENLLFAGTDNGLYVSFDQGSSWDLMQNGIPDVAVHDLVIQPLARHLVVGTHGRSIYKADISKLQKMTPETLAEDLVVFKIEPIKYSESWGDPPSAWGKPSTPGLDLVFYSKNKGAFSAKVKTSDNIVVSAAELEADRGLNILSFDVAFSKEGKSAYLKKHKKELKEAKNGKTYLPEGKYVVEISGNGTKQEVAFEIAGDGNK
jgi:hypothetical protein